VGSTLAVGFGGLVIGFKSTFSRNSFMSYLGTALVK
jgi:hypothetical protein